MRIDSVLKSINFNNAKQGDQLVSTDNGTIPNVNSKTILNPPILKGLELELKEIEVTKNQSPNHRLKQINLRRDNQKIDNKGLKSGITKVITKNQDNNFLKLDDVVDKNIKIIQPPNFMY